MSRLSLSAILGTVIACNIVAWLLVVHHHNGLLSQSQAGTVGGPFPMHGDATDARQQQQKQLAHAADAMHAAVTSAMLHARASLHGESETTPGGSSRRHRLRDARSHSLGGEGHTTGSGGSDGGGSGSGSGLLGRIAHWGTSTLGWEQQAKDAGAAVVSAPPLSPGEASFQKDRDPEPAPLPPLTSGTLAQLWSLGIKLDSQAQAVAAQLEASAQKAQLVQADKAQEQGRQQMPDPRVVKNQTDWPVWWFAPFFDRTSFGQEARTLLLGAIRSGALNESTLWLGTTEEKCDYEVDTSMPRVDFDQLDDAVKRVDKKQAAIVVCHSLPPFWARPRHHWGTCAPCPPLGYKAALAVGRAMAETDIYHWAFVDQCNRMDEVWVPSKFSYDTLKLSGVNESKLHIVPIAVNTTMFDPALAKPLTLPAGDLVFGRMRRFAWHHIVLQEDLAGGSLRCPEIKDDDTYACAKVWAMRAECKAQGRRDCEKSWTVHTPLNELRWPTCPKVPGFTAMPGSDHAGSDIGCFEGDDVHQAADACRLRANCSAFNLDPYQGHWCLKNSTTPLEESHAGICFYQKDRRSSSPAPGAKPLPVSTPSTLARLMVTAGRRRVGSSSSDGGSSSGGSTSGSSSYGSSSGGGGSSGGGSSVAGKQRQVRPLRQGRLFSAIPNAAAVGGGGALRQLRRAAEKEGTGMGAAKEELEEDEEGEDEGEKVVARQKQQQQLLQRRLRRSSRRRLLVEGDVAPSPGGRLQEVAAAVGSTVGRTEGEAGAESAGGGGSGAAGVPPSVPRGLGAGQHRRPFVFVSTFKWEMRKGWDVLLNAYLKEFSSRDNVELLILTKPFAGSTDNFKGTMHQWAAQNLNLTRKGRADAPTMYVISTHLTSTQYTGLYRSSDCYVIPTRGEGWGMPITEAMAMGLPAIVTNWSGTADFVTDAVGYPVRYNLSKVPDDALWWFKGARWADVDVPHLRSVMRYVYDHPEEAKVKGAAARRLMHDFYSPAAVGRALAVQVQRIKANIRAGNCSNCFNPQYVAGPDIPWELEEYGPDGVPHRPEPVNPKVVQQWDKLKGASLAAAGNEAKVQAVASLMVGADQQFAALAAGKAALTALRKHAEQQQLQQRQHESQQKEEQEKKEGEEEGKVAEGEEEGKEQEEEEGSPPPPPPPPPPLPLEPLAPGEVEETVLVDEKAEERGGGEWKGGADGEGGGGGEDQGEKEEEEEEEEEEESPADAVGKGAEAGGLVERQRVSGSGKEVLTGGQGGRKEGEGDAAGGSAKGGGEDLRRGLRASGGKGREGVQEAGVGREKGEGESGEEGDARGAATAKAETLG